MAEKWTRREAAGALLAAAAVPAARSQERTPQQRALAEAREELARTRRKLQEFPLPEDTAPAFVFRP